MLVLLYGLIGCLKQTKLFILLLYSERIERQLIITITTANITDVVFLTEFPLGLLFEGDNLYLSQWCLALYLSFV